METLSYGEAAERVVACAERTLKALERCAETERDIDALLRKTNRVVGAMLTESEAMLEELVERSR